MRTEANRRNPGPSKGVRWALGLSLALNLVIVGVIAGMAYRYVGGPGAHGSSGPGWRHYASPYVAALPVEEQRALREQLRKREGAERLSRAARRQSYDQVLVALRKEPLDRAAIEAVLTTQHDAAVEMQGIAHTAWLERIARMDAAARSDYADALEDILRRGPRRKAGGKRD